MKLPRLAFLTLLAVPSLLRAADAPARLEMTGLVTNPAGEPVPDAIVTILAAGPRKGSSPLCPYNYEDCGKRTTSDALGQFRLPSLDPTMDFCISALAPGYESYVNSSLLPESGPVKVKLRPRDLSKLPANRHVAGRIIDQDGRPVMGAIIDVGGVVNGTTTRWGGNDATESRVVTDAQGEFHLGGRKDFDAVHVTVEAPGLADRWAVLETGKNALLRMKTGSSLKGRLLWKGHPLAGVEIAGSSEERACGSYYDASRVLTDADGRFVFPNLPSGVKFRIFGLIGSMREHGAAYVQSVTTAPDGQVTDMGDVEAKPSYRFSGQVVLADGKPIPAQTRIMLARDDIRDTSLAMLDEQGRFEFTGVPAERVTLYVDIKGYRWSEKNPSLDRDQMSQVTGLIPGDLTGFKILLEPGVRPSWDSIDHSSSWEESEKRRKAPLQSAP